MSVPRARVVPMIEFTMSLDDRPIDQETQGVAISAHEVKAIGPAKHPGAMLVNKIPVHGDWREFAMLMGAVRVGHVRRGHFRYPQDRDSVLEEIRDSAQPQPRYTHRDNVAVAINRGVDSAIEDHRGRTAYAPPSGRLGSLDTFRSLGR